MKKVLIVKLSSLGDLFHALPTAHNLKEGLDAEIHWVVANGYVDLVDTCFPDVSRVIAFHRKDFFANLRPFLRELRAERYDAVVDLHGLLKSAAITLLARGDVKIGPSFAREGSRLLYPRVAGKRNDARHVVEQCMDAVDALGVEHVPPVFPVEFPVYDVDLPGPRIAVVPMSRRHTKTWPAECFVDVIRRLRAVGPASVYLVGGRDEQSLCARMAAEIGGDVADLAGTLSLTRVGGLLEQMDLVIANDSGPAHMAAAAGTPTLAVFGSTDPVRNGPYGPRNRVVTAGLECQPCWSRVCDREGVPCLEKVTPEHVTEAALEMLGKR